MNSFKCQLCDAICTGLDSFQRHMEGSKHKKKRNLEAAILCRPEPPTTDVLAAIDVISNECRFKVEADGLSSSTTPLNTGNCDSLTISSHDHQPSNTSPLTANPDQNLLPYISDTNYLSDIYTCHTCTVSCTGPLAYEQHIDGKNHAKKMKHLKFYSSDVSATVTENAASNNAGPSSILLDSASFTEVEHLTDHKPMQSIASHIYEHSASEPDNFDAAKVKNGLLSNTASINVSLREKLAHNFIHETNTVLEHGLMDKPNHINIATGSLLKNNNPPMNLSCSLCQVSCTGPEQYSQHISGKSHAKKLKFQNFQLSIASPLATTASNIPKHASLKQEPSHNQDQTGNGITTSLDTTLENDTLEQRSSIFFPKQVNAAEEPVKRYSISDFKNTTSNFKCDICDVSCGCLKSCILHMNGRQHTKKMAHYKSVYPDSASIANNILHDDSNVTCNDDVLHDNTNNEDALNIDVALNESSGML